jgi:hypothetical protein
VPGTNAQQPTPFDVTYTSLATNCTDTLKNGLTVLPPAIPVLSLSPGAFAPFNATITPASAGPPPVPASVAPSSPQTVNIVNTGSAPLNITSISTSGAGCARFSVVPTIPPTVTLNQCETQPLIVQYNGSVAPGSDQCTVNITTNAGNRSLSLIGTSQ